MQSFIFSPPSKPRATLELLFASGIWGFSFIAQAWLLTGMGPFWGNGIRFLIASLVGAIICINLPALKPEFNTKQLRLALFPGIFLGGSILLQTYGLRLTTVTKTSFITVLYVVFVPLINWLYFGRRTSLLNLVLILVSLIGISLICKLKLGQWNPGDLFVLGCAIVAAMHIISLDVIASEVNSGFVLNTFQSLWASALCLVFAPFLDSIYGPLLTTKFISGLLISSLVSSLIAFSIQVRVQKVLSTVLVSMIFLLESPFASLFAFFIFDERMSFWQWIGALLILLAAAGTIVADMIKSKDVSEHSA